MYKVRCPTADAKHKPKYRILHRNRLLLVTNEDDVVVPGQSAQASVTSCAPNATLEAPVVEEGSSEPLPSLVTQQEGDMTSWVWLNGEFHTKPWTQTRSKAPKSPPDQVENEVSDIVRGDVVPWLPGLRDRQFVRCHILLLEPGVLLSCSSIDLRSNIP